MTKKTLNEFWIGLIATIAVGALMGAVIYYALVVERYTAVTEDTVEFETIEDEEVEVVVTSKIEATPTPSTTVVESVKKEVAIFDIALEEELQLHILNECEKYGIDPAVVTAMAYMESRYQANAVGDKGNSLGLLQIQPRWNEARMEKLGCTDLLDPYQNVTVAVDILAEMLEHYNGNIEKAVTAYNMGMTGAYNNCFSKGVNASQYTQKVLLKAGELRTAAYTITIE